MHLIIKIYQGNAFEISNSGAVLAEILKEYNNSLF